MVKKQIDRLSDLLQFFNVCEKIIKKVFIMDEIAILEVLRQKLKDNVDALIDNAIRQIRGMLFLLEFLWIDKKRVECI